MWCKEQEQQWQKSDKYSRAVLISYAKKGVVIL